jgi:hypothetical protein
MKNTVLTDAAAKNQMLAAPVPQETRTYKPVSHKELMDLTLESIYQSGFALKKEYYSVAREGNVATAHYTISNVADNEMNLQIVWQNSYDKSLSLKFALGTSIIVCSNGMVTGDYGSFKKKHMGEIQSFTPTAITDYIKDGGTVFRQIQEQRDTLKEVEISEQAQAELLGRLFIEQDLITSTQLNIVKRELKNPTYNYGADGSMWELYNHLTFAMKKSHPSDWLNDHINLHEFFMNQAVAKVSPNQPYNDFVNQLNLFI